MIADYLEGYQYGAENVQFVRRNGWARGKGWIKSQIKSYVLLTSVRLGDWRHGVIDAYLDSIN